MLKDEFNYVKKLEVKLADQADTIAQLQADNAKLRAALQVCKFDCETGEVIGIAKEALGETEKQNEYITQT